MCGIDYMDNNPFCIFHLQLMFLFDYDFQSQSNHHGTKHLTDGAQLVEEFIIYHSTTHLKGKQLNRDTSAILNPLHRTNQSIQAISTTL